VTETTAQTINEFPRCDACGFSILVLLANNVSRCYKCGHEQPTKSVENSPLLFTIGGAGL
jgi:predicted Zn-ribbon and HTH transcriptional regulator